MQAERVALVLDLENLVGPPPNREAALQLRDAMSRIRSGRTVISAVAYCARALQRTIAFDLAQEGVRVFGHSDPGADAADRLILEHLRVALPASTTTVVIGSGDHIFAPIAQELTGRDLIVEVACRPGTLAATLYRQASRWHPVGTAPFQPPTQIPSSIAA